MLDTCSIASSQGCDNFGGTERQKSDQNRPSYEHLMTGKIWSNTEIRKFCSQA